MHKELELHFIKRGDVAIAEEPVIFKTTLGSCVSVCLWDRRLRMGGINHYTSPLCDNDKTPLNMCGEHAIKTLIDGFTRKGSRKPDIEAGVFGGGSLLSIDTHGLRVGPGNVDIAYKVLNAHGIQVVSSNTGHTHGLNVFFNTSDGTMELKSVKSPLTGIRKSRDPALFLKR